MEIILGVLVAAFAVIFLVYSFLRWQRQQALSEVLDVEFSQDRLKRLWRNVPLLRHLESSVQERLMRQLKQFVFEKNWEACGGLESVTEEMKDTIAAQACLLVVANGLPLYPSLRSVLIYPSAYKVETDQGSGRRHSTRLGESWDSGSVVLSWKGVVSGNRDEYDGFNLVIHEFSHQLDQSNGLADGVPVLGKGQSYRKWAEAFTKAFDDFCDDVNHNKNVLLDDYGATNEAEFFAVASETFFETPKRLHEAYPQIYELMRDFYQLDPLSWEK